MTDSQKNELQKHLVYELQSMNPVPEATIAIEYTADEMDYASQVTQRNLNLALAERVCQKNQQLHDALCRINSPGFGICQECGESIGMARLKANPVASLCVHCQEENDNDFGACA